MNKLKREPHKINFRLIGQGEMVNAGKNALKGYGKDNNIGYYLRKGLVPFCRGCQHARTKIEDAYS
jgi:hypothetical protein